MTKHYYTTDNGFEKAESLFRLSGRILKLLLMLSLFCMGQVVLYRTLPLITVASIDIVMLCCVMFALMIRNAKCNDKLSDIEEWERQRRILQDAQRQTAAPSPEVKPEWPEPKETINQKK